MRILRPVAIALLVFAAARPLFADFDDLGMGARAMGMGDAFTGLADDNRAIYYNPAGLAWQRQAQLGADYSRIQIGLDDKSEISLGFVSYSHPLFKFQPKETPADDVSTSTVTAAAKIPETRVLIVEGKPVPVTTPPAAVDVSSSPYRPSKPLMPQYGTLGVAVRNFGLAGAYQENSYYFSYARSVMRRWSWGANIKFLQEKYVQDAYTKIDPVFAAKSGLSALSGDLGVLWNYRARFFWGASILDFNRPDVGLKQSERLPATFKTGLGYKDARTAVAVDVTSRGGGKRLGGGLERWLGRGRTALRAGLDLGEGAEFNTALGFSFRVSVFQIDYGFQFPLTGVSGTAGTHRLSFVYRLGRPPKDEVEAGSLESSYYDLQDEKTALEKKLRAVEQERDHLEDVLVEEATQHIRERISFSIQDGKRQAGVATQTHIIRSGDTLMALAYYYYRDSSRWKEIYDANRDKVGRGGRLKPGNFLVIPGKTVHQAAPPPVPDTGGAKPVPSDGTDVSTETVKPKPPKPAPKPAKPKPALEPVQRFHTVKSGDTLESIAQQHYGDSKRWVEIYRANKNKVTRGAVEAGQVLVIP